jgi:hypothetical protein
MVRPEGITKSRTASMELKRAGISYRCLRLPPSAARFAPGQAAPAAETPGEAPSAAPADTPQPAEPAGAPAPEPMK